MSIVQLTGLFAFTVKHLSHMCEQGLQIDIFDLASHEAFFSLAHITLTQEREPQINMCRLRVSWGRANQNAKFQRSPQSEELPQGVKQEREGLKEGVAVEQVLDAPANAEMAQQMTASYMDERELHMAPKYLPAGIAIDEGH